MENRNMSIVTYKGELYFADGDIIKVTELIVGDGNKIGVNLRCSWGQQKQKGSETLLVEAKSL
jgi:hypothetical protein